MSNNESLNASDVFKVLVEYQTSVQKILEFNTKSLTEMTTAVRSFEQAIKDQNEIVRRIETFMLDNERKQDKLHSMFLDSVEKINLEMSNTVKKVYTDSEERMTEFAAKIEAKESKKNNHMIYYLMAIIFVLLATILGFVGYKVIVPDVPGVISNDPVKVVTSGISNN